MLPNHTTSLIFECKENDEIYETLLSEIRAFIFNHLASSSGSESDSELFTFLHASPSPSPSSVVFCNFSCTLSPHFPSCVHVQTVKTATFEDVMHVYSRHRLKMDYSTASPLV
ncbi:hypothetical protein ACS0TY_020755 [Phlomoides rotata]